MRPTDHPTQARWRRCAALGLTVAVHALLWLALVEGARQEVAPAAARLPLLTVTLVALPSAQAAPAPASMARAADRPAAPAVRLSAAVVNARAALHYFFPAELDRELMLLIDRSDEADIALPHEITMHLFVSPNGKVADIVFEGAAPRAVQAQLRAAFATMEFLPGLKGGQPVPARIKIVIAPRSPGGADE